MIEGAAILLVGILLGLSVPQPHRENLTRPVRAALDYKKKAFVIDMDEPDNHQIT